MNYLSQLTSQSPSRQTSGRWGENSVWEIGLASRRGTVLQETGSQADSVYRDGGRRIKIVLETVVEQQYFVLC